MSFYGDEAESDLHLLMECHFARALAFGSCWGLKLETIARRVHRAGDIQSLVMLILEPPSDVINRAIDKAFFTNILTCLFSTIWSYRNEKLFEGKRHFHQAVLYFERCVADFSSSLRTSTGSNVVSKEARWKPPPESWLKANVDAAVGETASAIALVVRDHQGNLVFLASSVIDSMEPAFVELKALEWATSLLFERGWKNIEWCSDAKTIVNDIVSDKEPMSWWSRDDILLIKHRSETSTWEFSWTPRGANKLADLVAKSTLTSRNELLFCNSFVNLPLCFVNQLCLDNLATECL